MFWLSDLSACVENGHQLRWYEDRGRGRRTRANALRHTFAAAGRDLLGSGAAASRRLVSWIRSRHNRRRTLRTLNYLDDHLLADIGLTRNDVALLHRRKWPTRYTNGSHESTASKIGLRDAVASCPNHATPTIRSKGYVTLLL
jgi:uncharacterized protein YjiS (DUF1127 family)